MEVGEILGDVRRIGLRSSTVRTWDGAEVVIPNSRFISQEFTNWTLSDRQRRIDIPVGVAYGSDPERVIEILLEVARAHPDILEEPEPIVEVHSLGESSVDFVVRPWVRTVNYWPTYWAITREVKQRFDREGVSIPFPQRDVHHYFEQSPPTA